MILLLDSSVLIDVLRTRMGRDALLAKLTRQGHSLATTAINVGEVYSGVRLNDEATVAALLEDLDIYPVTEMIARKAGLLRNSWARRGRTLELPDMIVAATALEYGLTVMTDNRKDFPMPDLTLFDLP